MVIQMVTGQVGENTSRIFETSYAFLNDSVRAALHEHILAALIGHTSKQTVQGNGIWGGMIGRNGLAVNVIAYG